MTVQNTSRYDLVIFYTYEYNTTDHLNAQCLQCSSDSKTNRPNVIRVLLNGYNIQQPTSQTDYGTIEKNLLVVLHEISHGLGFSLDTFTKFNLTTNVLSTTLDEISTQVLNNSQLTSNMAKYHSYPGLSYTACHTYTTSKPKIQSEAQNSLTSRCFTGNIGDSGSYYTASTSYCLEFSCNANGTISTYLNRNYYPSQVGGGGQINPLGYGGYLNMPDYNKFCESLMQLNAPVTVLEEELAEIKSAAVKVDLEVETAAFLICWVETTQRRW